MNDYNTSIINEFRANGGEVSQGFGTNLVLVHSTGAKTGAERIHPVLGLRDGDAWLIAASKAGAPEHPAWYHNLVANPEVTIEAADLRGGIDTVQVRATVLDGTDHDVAWARFLAASPVFAQYEETTGGRRIPVVRLAPR